jgi:hypothetical protein
MPHRFQISRDSQALYITLNTKNRLPVFRKDEIKKVLCEAIDEARKSAGFLLFAYVIVIGRSSLRKGGAKSSQQAAKPMRSSFG